jgi:predicted MFS family arabinose efflux permease
MMAYSGTGAVAGALVVAWLGRFRHMGVTALVVQVALGALIVAFALTRVLWVTHVLLLVAGAALVVSTSLVTSLAQLLAPNDMRGRVMSIYMLAFRGGMPLGSLVSGKIADMTSVPVTLVINGILLTCAAGYFLLRKQGIRDA